METYAAIGIMSGSSLDGVDLVYCTFTRASMRWRFKILAAETVPYNEEWRSILQTLPNQYAHALVENDIKYGIFLGELINSFCRKHQINAALIASHGHTIFHDPANAYTFQLGNGQAIASQTGIKTVSDFRSKDISLGGQGAPLVPIGDQFLFPEYGFCLNIGGIANISFVQNGKRCALDICGANQLLNHLSNQIGKPYDAYGSIAQLGKLDTNLFNLLNSDSYFDLPFPKSLSNQKVQHTFIPMIDDYQATIEDKLYTVVKHIAFQINKTVSVFPKSDMLVTGGGAHNRFLINAIRYETKHKITLPEKQVIDYKEALIFAFMGVLRNLEEINCLASSTGAHHDSCCGIICNP